MQSDGNSRLPEGPAPEPIQELFPLVVGYRISQAIYVVAKLGIPDLLAGGPQDSDALAQATGTHAGALYRILRCLAGVGLFGETAPHAFGLTALGARLCTDAPGSTRSTALMLLDPPLWQAWGSLLHTVQTGEPAFQHVHGQGMFEYLVAHPDSSRVFQQAMTSNTAGSGTAITQAYDFSGIGRLVDVGGGHGLLLATALQAYPDMRGVLFDRPEVVAGAPAVLEAAGVADRCEIVGGDFFASAPPGGDAYVLRQILHDWDDVRAAQILAHCRRALGETGKVLVMERAIARDYRQALPVLLLDLEMLVNFGGIQRTEAEYRALFAGVGLQLSAVVPLGDAAQFSVFEGVPA
jgi:O-methyltransferase domain/Dimerisation domain